MPFSLQRWIFLDSLSAGEQLAYLPACSGGTLWQDVLAGTPLAEKITRSFALSRGK
jgi:hypothetical protein